MPSRQLLVGFVAALSGHRFAAAACSEGAGSGLRSSATTTSGLRSPATTTSTTTVTTVQKDTGVLRDRFALHKRFNLAQNPAVDFNIETYSDEFLTHSCANYTNDGSTVFTRGGELVLKVASPCKSGLCLNSGRVMSKQSFKYGLFTFSAKVPKCNYVWPAIWLLPQDVNGTGAYGTWPCSGEIDVMETVHDVGSGTFNLVAGYGTPTWGCNATKQLVCNGCGQSYCTSSTMNPEVTLNPYYVEPDADCVKGPARQSWKLHRFVLNWQPQEVTTWVDPTLEWDSRGRLVRVTPKVVVNQTMPTWKTFRLPSTPTWQAAEDYMNKCFPGQATKSAPFDIGFKIVLNIAVGGYGGAPCVWGQDTCQSKCGGAVDSELALSDISVWQKVA